jgi:hypothetical protein
MLKIIHMGPAIGERPPGGNTGEWYQGKITLDCQESYVTITAGLVLSMNKFLGL